MITNQFELQFFILRDTLVAYSPSMGRWSDGVMMQVWAFGGDPKNTDENLIALNGMHVAWCCSDDTPSDWDNLTPIEDPSDIDCPTLMFAIAVLANEIANNKF
jgi:hypothetical protein